MGKKVSLDTFFLLAIMPLTLCLSTKFCTKSGPTEPRLLASLRKFRSRSGFFVGKIKAVR